VKKKLNQHTVTLTQHYRSSDVDSSPRPAFMLIVDYPVVELEDHSSRGVSVRGSPQKLLVDLNLH
jgi:hypothetical protein